MGLATDRAEFEFRESLEALFKRGPHLIRCGIRIQPSPLCNLSTLRSKPLVLGCGNPHRQ
jgi:hypothetical protein